MDIITQPILLAGMLAEVHRSDLEREIEVDRRARLVEAVRPRGIVDIVTFGTVLLVSIARELLPWPGRLADVDRRAGEASGHEGATRPVPGSGHAASDQRGAPSSGVPAVAAPC